MRRPVRFTGTPRTSTSKLASWPPSPAPSRPSAAILGPGRTSERRARVKPTAFMPHARRHDKRPHLRCAKHDRAGALKRFPLNVHPSPTTPVPEPGTHALTLAGRVQVNTTCGAYRACSNRWPLAIKNCLVPPSQRVQHFNALRYPSHPNRFAAHRLWSARTRPTGQTCRVLPG